MRQDVPIKGKEDPGIRHSISRTLYEPLLELKGFSIQALSNSCRRNEL